MDRNDENHYHADVLVPFNWFWMLATRNQVINLEAIYYRNLNMLLLKDISFWPYYLADEEIVRYFGHEEYQSQLFKDTLEGVQRLPGIMELVKSSEVQFLESKKSSASVCPGSVVPNLFRCKNTCELIRTDFICNGLKECLDGSDEAGDICSKPDMPYKHQIQWPKLVGPNVGPGSSKAILAKSVISDSKLFGLKEITVCFTVTELVRAPIVSYGDDGRDFFIHFDAHECISMVLFKEYPVYFAVKHDIMDINRICIRMDAKKEITLYTNGMEFRDQRTLSEIPAELTFGRGNVTIGSDVRSGMWIRDSKMTSLNIWDTALSNHELSLYTTLPTCAKIDNTLIGWTDVLDNLEGTSGKNEVNNADARKLLLKPFHECSNDFTQKHGDDWDNFESLTPPDIPGTSVRLLEGIDKLVHGVIGTPELASEHEDGYLLPLNQKLCFKYNFKAKRQRRFFTVVIALGNPYGLSDVHLDINGKRLVHLCLHCKPQSYTQIIADIPLINDTLCLYDARRENNRPMFGYPFSNLTGSFIKKILIKEQPKTWLCKEEVIEQHLYGKFLWGATNTISTAMCPLGYAGMIWRVGYASKVCEVTTDSKGKQTGKWEDHTSLGSCQHRFEYDNLTSLLDTVEDVYKHRPHLLTGDDLMTGVVSAIDRKQVFTENIVTRLIDIIQKILALEKQIPGKSCWYSYILQAIFGSKYNEFFKPFKTELLPALTAGGLDNRCTKSFIHHNMFRVDNTTPLMIIKCIFGKKYGLNITKSQTSCVDISGKNRTTVAEQIHDNDDFGTESVMIIQTSTRDLADLGITKIFVTTVKALNLLETYFAREIHINNMDVGVTLISPNIAIKTDIKDTTGGEKLKFHFYYRNSNKGMTYAYCAHEKENRTEKDSFRWSNTETALVNRGKHFVNCSSSVVIGENEALGVITNKPFDRWGTTHTQILSTCAIAADIVTIIFLVITAIVCGCWVHDCTEAAQLYVAFSVFYGGMYTMKVFSGTVLNEMSECSNYSAVIYFCLIACVIMLLSAGIALHIYVEDGYEVPYFVVKSVLFSLIVPGVILSGLIIYDKVTSPSFKTIFITTDTSSDLTPIACWLTAPISYGAVIFPIVLCFVALSICLHRLRIVLDKDEDGESDMTLALIKGTLIIALLVTVTWVIGTLGLASDDLTLHYLFVAFNSVQGLVICFFLCVYSTTLCASLFSNIQTKKLEIMAEQEIAGNYDLDSQGSGIGAIQFHSDTTSVSESMRSDDSYAYGGGEVSLLGRCMLKCNIL